MKREVRMSMPHVDEGTLHAYLDGELRREEMERLRAHIEECAVCRGRLEEERALVERASRLLERAAPPVTGRPVPEFERLRPRSRPRLPFVPLAWAATLLLAIGAGWYLHDMYAGDEAIAPPNRTPEAPTVVATAPAAASPAPPPPTARADQPRRRAMAEQRPAAEPIASAKTGLVEGQVAAESIRQALPPAAAFDEAVVTTGAASQQQTANGAARVAARPNIYIDGAPIRVAWSDVSADSARALLGRALAMIPGIPITRIQTIDEQQRMVRVTFAPDSHTTIQLYEQPAEADKVTAALVTPVPTSNQRLARYVGSLRVEITGSVSTDSLSRLLDLVR